MLISLLKLGRFASLISSDIVADVSQVACHCNLLCHYSILLDFSTKHRKIVLIKEAS